MWWNGKSNHGCAAEKSETTKDKKLNKINKVAYKCKRQTMSFYYTKVEQNIYSMTGLLKFNCIWS